MTSDILDRNKWLATGSRNIAGNLSCCIYSLSCVSPQELAIVSPCLVSSVSLANPYKKSMAKKVDKTSSVTRSSRVNEVPITDRVKTDCVNRIVAATSALFSPFQREDHNRYAKLFVEEVAIMLSELRVQLKGREEILLQVVEKFVSGAEKFKAETNLWSEIGWMFELIEKELQETSH